MGIFIGKRFKNVIHLYYWIVSIFVDPCIVITGHNILILFAISLKLIWTFSPILFKGYDIT